MAYRISSTGARRLSRVSAIFFLAAAAAIAGCSALNLGPFPSTYVGTSAQALVEPPTDAHLQAVLPEVPGDRPGGGADLPSLETPTTLPGTAPAGTPNAVPGSSGVVPATLPAALPATQPSGTPPAAPAVVAPPEALSVQDAILIGLENNINLRVQKLTVPIKRQGEESQRAAFDPDVKGTVQGGRQVTGLGPTGIPGFGASTTDSVNANGQITEVLPSGTTITASATTDNSFYSESQLTPSGQINVTQSLLRGGDMNANLAALREAELATKISQYDLRGVAESLVATIETDYWTLAYDERQVTIEENNLKLAQSQLDQTNAEIRSGRDAPTEAPAAEATVAKDRELLINANSQLDEDRLAFFRAITPNGRQFWNRTVKLTTLPFIPTGGMDPVEDHVGVMLRLRPDINEARLSFQSDTLEVVRTKNGLLPQLDLFVTLGKSSFASTFGESFENLNGPDFQAILGVNYDWSPVNRAATAAYRVATLTREQEQQSIDDLVQLDELDVRRDYIEVMRTLAQIPATRATREADEASLQAEEGKFLQGRSTSILVATAQQTLLGDELAEVQAVTGHLTALVTLYQDEGSLLLRRGIQAPGAAPPVDPAWRK